MLLTSKRTFRSTPKPDITLMQRGRGARERVTGIEPVYSAWKAAVLPLYYTRMLLKPLGFQAGSR
jgi:hypothetical protein